MGLVSPIQKARFSVKVKLSLSTFHFKHGFDADANSLLQLTLRSIAVANKDSDWGGWRPTKIKIGLPPFFEMELERKPKPEWESPSEEE